MSASYRFTPRKIACLSFTTFLRLRPLILFNHLLSHNDLRIPLSGFDAKTTHRHAPFLLVALQEAIFQFTIQNVKIRMYKIIILPVDLCLCETWSLTFTEECRLRVFDNRVLRRIFGLKRHEVIRVCKEELYALYSSPNIITVIK